MVEKLKFHMICIMIYHSPGGMKIKQCNNLVCNLYDKKLCCSHKSFKTSIKSWNSIKNVHRVIRFKRG